MATTKKTGKGTPTSKRYAIIKYIHSKNAAPLTLSNYLDPDTKKTVYLKDSSGNEMEWTIRPPQIKLDLNIADDKLKYEFILKHIYVIGANPKLRVVNVNAEAKEENDRLESTMQLNARIVAMEEEELLDYGLILGFDSSLGDNDVIKNRIYKYIAKQPVEALEKLEDPDYKLRVLIHKAKRAGDIKEENGVFKYGTLILGSDQDNVVLWLKDNPIVRESLSNRFEEVAA